MKERPRGYPFGIVGNCAYSAAIDDHGGVAWLCWPRFDSSFVFGPLLDADRGGEFTIAPAGGVIATRQTYIENTNVLSTEVTCPDGRYRILDFAPRFRLYERYYKPLMLVRKIERIEGNPRIIVTCRPVGEYGDVLPHTHLGSNHLRFVGLTEPLRLSTDVPLSYVIEQRPFALMDDSWLVLTWGVPLEAPLEDTASSLLDRTTRYWHTWVEHCHVPSFRQELVIRSALALKLHQFEDTGALIAATTTSLPEAPGSGRNWDYRYCWLREPYYVLSAFNNLGHFEEMKRFASFVQNVVPPTGRVQPVYGIRGDWELTERELPLAGWMGHGPVRVGNQAHTHVQNDVYGQLLLSLLPLFVDRRFGAEARLTTAPMVRRMLEAIEETMDEEDAGLWELRNTSMRHTYTYLFHWAGAAAAERIATELKDAPLLKLATKLRAEAQERVERCFDKNLGTYGHAEGSPYMDASLLSLVTMGYLDPTSETARRLVERVEQELRVGRGLLYRYSHADDFGKPEVAFVVCGFWYVEALAMVGRIDDAIEAFDGLASTANHLGLLSEDADPVTGMQWGNFPQTYSHVGIVNSAARIAARLDQPAWLAR